VAVAITLNTVFVEQDTRFRDLGLRLAVQYGGAVHTLGFAESLDRE